MHARCLLSSVSRVRLESRYKAGPKAAPRPAIGSLDFLFLVSHVIIALPGPLFRGTRDNQSNVTPILPIVTASYALARLQHDAAL